jgi:hypothetical protein
MCQGEGGLVRSLGHHSGMHHPFRVLGPRAKIWQSQPGCIDTCAPKKIDPRPPLFRTQLLHGNVHEGENLAKAMRRIKAGAKDKDGGEQALLDKLTDAADKLLTMGYHNVFTDNKTQVCSCVSCGARASISHAVRACVHSRVCVFGVVDVVVAAQIGGRLQASQQQAQTKEQGASQAEAFAAMMAFDDGRQWEYQFPQVGPISTQLSRKAVLASKFS